MSPGCRTTGSTSSCGSSRTTRLAYNEYPDDSLDLDPSMLDSTSGNLTCSLPMRRGPTSTRDHHRQQTAQDLPTGRMSSTASGGVLSGSSPLNPQEQAFWGGDPKKGRAKQRVKNLTTQCLCKTGRACSATHNQQKRNQTPWELLEVHGSL